jgi:hypothetical protein
MSTRGDPRAVRLDDQTKSILYRAIAREQSLSRLLMTYVVTGLYSCSCPARFLGMESHRNQQPRSRRIHFTSLDSGAWPRPAVRWLGTFNRVLLDTEAAKAETVCTLVHMAHVGALRSWRDPPLVVEYLSVALACGMLCASN